MRTEYSYFTVGEQSLFSGDMSLQAPTLLLTINADTVTAIAAVGYNNPVYFTEVFTRHIGVSPSRFRRELARTRK